MPPVYYPPATTGAVAAEDVTGLAAAVQALIEATALSDLAAPDADVAMGTHKLTGLGAATAAADAAQLAQVQAADPGRYRHADHGLVAWTFPIEDIQHAGSGAPMVAGVMRVTRLRLKVAATITNLHFYVHAAGTALSNCYAALLGSDGTRLGVTADLSSGTGGWNATGYKTNPLASPVANVPAGAVYVAQLVGAQSTAVGFGQAPGSNLDSATLMNAGLVAPSLRAMTSGTGLTAIPTSVDLSAAGSSGRYPWIGLS